MDEITIHRNLCPEVARNADDMARLIERQAAEIDRLQRARAADAPAIHPFDMTKAARTLMRAAHQGQFRKNGTTPYAEHPEAVVNILLDTDQRFDDVKVKAVALLHDVVEDTAVTLDVIRALFGDLIADGVDALSRRKGESYSRYLDRVDAAPLWVRDIKAADVIANLRDSVNVGDPGWVDRFRKMKSKFLDRVGVSADMAALLRAEIARLGSAPAAPAKEAG